jgi:hypothetical protein
VTGLPGKLRFFAADFSECGFFAQQSLPGVFLVFCETVSEFCFVFSCFLLV